MKFSQTATFLFFSVILLVLIVCVVGMLALFTMFFSYSITTGLTPQPAIRMSSASTPPTTMPIASPSVTATAPPVGTKEISATPTQTPPPSATPTLTPTETPSPQDIPATEQVDPQATEQSQEMLEALQELYEDGYINTTDAVIYQLPDFEDNWNEVGGYRTSYVDYGATDFVIRAAASWETGGGTTTYTRSGCGFVFREESVGNHYLIYLGLDGRIHLGRVEDNVLTLIGQSNYLPIESPVGRADILLAVNEAQYTFIANFEGSQLTYYPQDNTFRDGSIFGLSLVSGTSLGTTCKMEKVMLAALEVTP